MSKAKETVKDEVTASIETKARRKVGRPPALEPDDQTLAQIAELASIFCTVEEAAGVLGVHRATLYSFFERHETARLAWELGQGDGKASLRRKQWLLASTNATMAIFLGKQMLGQKDQVAHEVTGKDGGPVEIKGIDVRVTYVDGGPDPDQPGGMA